MRIHCFTRSLSVVAALLYFWTPVVHADCPDAEPGKIVANPNRPTVADPADITQYGVLELEYGYAHVKAHFNEHENDLGGLLKFAATCNLEIRWDGGTFINRGDLNGSQSSTGDNWLGFQYRFHRQSRHLPATALSYSAKFPSASATKGLGSGRYDHQIKLLASKDVRGIHFDLNASVFQVGRPDKSGSDRNEEVNLAFSHPIYKALLFTGEFYGDTKLGRNSPAYASGLWAFTYAITPRLVIDAGMDHGLTSSSPHNRIIFAGFTYSIAALYGHMRSSP
jgi:hypothetical protein